MNTIKSHVPYSQPVGPTKVDDQKKIEALERGLQSLTEIVVGAREIKFPLSTSNEVLMRFSAQPTNQEITRMIAMLDILKDSFADDGAPDRVRLRDAHNLICENLK